MEPHTRAQLRRDWLTCLYEFSSPALQRLWITGDSRIVVSFTECTCGYFDDLNLGAGLEGAVEAGWLSPAESEALSHFHRMACEYRAPPGGDAAVLADPKWGELVRAARHAWLSVTKGITDIGERECIEELECRWGRIAGVPANPALLPPPPSRRG